MATYRLKPGLILSLDGPHLGGPSVRWALGAALERDIVGCHKRMLELFEAGDDDWFEAAGGDRYFTCDGDALRLKEDYFHIRQPSLPAGELHLRCTRRDDGRHVRIPVKTRDFPALRKLLPQLAAGTFAWNGQPGDDAALDAIATMLIERDVAVKSGATCSTAIRNDYRVSFIGHACLLLETPTTRVLVDPLFSHAAQPSMDMASMLHEKLDAVVITHPHRGHFHLDSMLLVDSAMPVHVPRPEAPPSIVNIDSIGLARAFGFRDVRTMSPWRMVRIGDIELLPLPFHGEGYGPEAPIDACAYAIRLGGKTLAGFVDAGSDHCGNMDDVARRLRALWGNIDFLFAPCADVDWPLHDYPRRPLYMPHAKERFTGSLQDCLRWADLLGACRLMSHAGLPLDDSAQEPVTTLCWESDGRETIKPYHSPCIVVESKHCPETDAMLENA